MAKTKKQSDCKDRCAEPQQSMEQTVEQDHFLLSVLIDYLAENNIISRAEFEDRLDLVESEFFADESETRKKKAGKPKKSAKPKRK